MNDTPHSRAADVLAAVDRTPYGSVVRDEAFRRQMVYESLISGADPVGREIGQQLRDGSLRPRELLAASDYHGFFRQARSQAERLDLDALAAAARAIATDDTSSAPDEPAAASGSAHSSSDWSWTNDGDEPYREGPWR
ncbi:hypothetical protein AB0J14_28560 [Micromonospora arborensis]|uniref:hypothetical protein n=1 Tax=Micromonospora arborensis TaxID=2116518 RepID=UPI0033E53581